MTNKEFKIPQCKIHKKDMRLIVEHKGFMSFVCGIDNCKETMDVLTIGVDRKDIKLKALWGWKDLLPK